ncbi:GntR family transcriptional regulator [Kribbella solani]|uniref:GntR family transcriptional regulator n=1 Tax=Kribbella solani TaxID=236067 RepID=UPI0029B3E377|nr:GntR family transcriptional regulator [Kribbella solani]MDX2968121.1 GntR family transcriptional regulator [Kribbella solani]MDX3004866.1 GntR family transcriptional regulator [Kribbella solani]
MTPRGSAVLRRRGAALYGELAGDLTDRIQHGEFAPGAKLPPEKELAEAYGVNRLTVRRALSLSTVLMPVGVAPADWDGANSLTSVLADQGHPVIRAERGFSAAAADDEIARWLDIAPGTPVLVVNGINTDHHGVPVMLLQHHTRADRAEYVIRLTEQLEGEE